MIVYRLTDAKYSNDLSGEGAKRSGGRWNKKGTAMIYTSESRALCATEIAVHTSLGNIPLNFNIVTIEIPDSIKILTIDSLPIDWKSFPHTGSTQKIGEKFIIGKKYLVMKAPSAVVEGDFNYLLNPNHLDIDKIKIIKSESFSFDPRLFKK